MRGKPVSETERARLASLDGYDILDSAREREYDDIVRRAATLCHCPLAAITLVGRDRQWFKASVGLPMRETERGTALCDHTIRGHDLLVVPDTLLDARFADYPVVSQPGGVRFYAGAPLHSAEGQALGALCVMDHRPRTLDRAEQHYLRLLADQVMMHLELRRQNNRFQRLTGIAGRLARVGAWSVDVATRQVSLSPEILALHNLGPSARMSLEESLNFYPPEEQPRIRALFRACIVEGKAFDEELQVMDASGQPFWVRGLAEPVFNDDRRVVRIDGAFQDISEQRRAVIALGEEKTRFEAAARATADAIWDWNCATDRLWWSEGMETLFGYRVADLEPDSRSWTTRIHPDDKKRVLTGIHKVIQSQQQKWQAEYRFLRKDGDIAYVSDRGYVIRDENGDAVRMVGGMSDVTERRQFLTNLTRQAALLDKSRDAIMVLDLERRITYWNQAAEDIYGWRQDQALGRRIDDVLGEERAILDLATQALLSNGKWSGRLTGRVVDGEAVISEAHWSLVGGDHGEPRAILAINTDITQRLALEEQLQQSQRLEAIGQLTGGVAHDFNNLLTVILGNAELLEDQLDPACTLLHSARLIRGAAERAAELTRRLLAFARRQPLDPGIVDVNELISGLAPLLRPTLHEHLDISILPCPAPWPAFIDPGQLESAILNLCINARDAMDDNGCIVLETANVTLDQHYARQHSEVAPGDYVQVVVSDTGHGIPAGVQERVFDPFFTTKPKGKGTGLGLSMVYGFVKQSRGHIKIYSEPGEGTTVKLYLPRARDARPEPSPPVSPVRYGNHKETVLIAEDDNGVREQAERQLRDLGYRVLSAADGTQALAILEEHPVDLLFTDVIMPGGPDGPELARRALRAHPGLRVLYTSGYTENAIVRHGRLAPGVHLLEKPYQKTDLDRKIRDVLDEVPR